MRPPFSGISTSYFSEVQNPTSKYNGVSWLKATKKWMTQFNHKGKTYYGGLFNNEEHAAMKINLLCDKCQIERKNPTINIEQDGIIQSVIHSFFKTCVFLF